MSNARKWAYSFAGPLHPGYYKLSTKLLHLLDASLGFLPCRNYAEGVHTCREAGLVDAEREGHDRPDFNFALALTPLFS